MSFDTHFLLMLYTCLIFGIIAGFIYCYLKFRKVFESLFDCSVTEIKNATSGKILLKGKIKKQDSLLVSPVSQKPCVGFTVYTSRIPTRRTGFNIRFAVTSIGSAIKLKPIVKCIDFEIEDETGSCLVKTSQVEKVLIRQAKKEIKYGDIPLVDGGDYSELELSDTNSDRSHPYMYSEACCKPGDMVYIYGRFSKNGESGNTLESFTEDAEDTIHIYRGEKEEFKRAFLTMMSIVSILSLFFTIIFVYFIIETLTNPNFSVLHWLTTNIHWSSLF